MLAVQHLTKVFAGGKGIHDITFDVQPGEVFGFLGPNGAGKSTTIRHIMGFMKPEQGSCTIKGMDTWKSRERVQQLVGYLPGEIAFFEGMTGKGFLDFMADMKHLKDHSRRQELIGRFQFDDRTPIRKMSKGMKQKVGIVAAFMHRPEVIILDEPTSGLDPLMQRLFIELVLEEKERGTTFLMSSHSFPEIERTCDRAAIIKDGKLVGVKNMHELRTMQRKWIDITFADADSAVKFSASGLDIQNTNRSRVVVAVQGGDYPAVLKELAKYPVVNLEIAAQNLEDIFMDYYDAGKEAAK
ncbi:ABC transporter ATP-binding protein [Paenibacillus physcomitrellae]|uniref:ABC transporter ATP-binding protein n=1 Tax=Paenibacillus physcomitrellae TaxID=1619311 RepID=A0ABQ1GSV5_9BACL|nr:ABC transporter ATP-binding protein [Paenibacillus physcomitrellae]GGA49439.1 ABC transporter ATP-binding protein [Paenibacillus physcomitrellae]